MLGMIITGSKKEKNLISCALVEGSEFLDFAVYPFS